jgi:hypothetical protein
VRVLATISGLLLVHPAPIADLAGLIGLAGVVAVARTRRSGAPA